MGYLANEHLSRVEANVNHSSVCDVAIRRTSFSFPRPGNKCIYARSKMLTSMVCYASRATRASWFNFITFVTFPDLHSNGWVGKKCSRIKKIEFKFLESKYNVTWVEQTANLTSKTYPYVVYFKSPSNLQILGLHSFEASMRVQRDKRVIRKAFVDG